MAVPKNREKEPPKTHCSSQDSKGDTFVCWKTLLPPLTWCEPRSMRSCVEQEPRRDGTTSYNTIRGLTHRMPSSKMKTMMTVSQDTEPIFQQEIYPNSLPYRPQPLMHCRTRSSRSFCLLQNMLMARTIFTSRSPLSSLLSAYRQAASVSMPSALSPSAFRDFSNTDPTSALLKLSAGVCESCARSGGLIVM